MRIRVLHFLFVTSILLLTACGTNRSSFVKQKFTQLKQLPFAVKDNTGENSTHQQSISIDLKAGLSKIPEIEEEIFLLEELDDTSKLIKNINESLEDRHIIFVNLRGRKLWLDKPELEDENLTGIIRPTSDIDASEKTITEIEIEGYVNLVGGRILITKDLLISEIVYPGKEALLKHEKIEKPEYIKSKEQAKSDPIYKRANKRFHHSLWCLGALVAGIGLAFIGIISIEAFLIFGIIIAVFAYLFGLVMLTNAATEMRRLLIQERNKGRKLHPSIQAQRVLIILGMMLFGSIPFLIPFLIMWAIVRKNARTKYY
jgi:hypothetical protein